jgi:hypothetical protein
MTKAEKGPRSGDKFAPKPIPKVAPPPSGYKQYGQKSLEPVYKTFRGGSR